MSLDLAEIGIGVDTTGLERGRRALKEIGLEADKTVAKINRLGRSGTIGRNTTAGIERTGRAINETGRAATRTGSTFDRLSAQSQALSRTMALLAGAFGIVALARLSDEYVKFEAQLRLATDSSKDFGNAMIEVQRIAEATQGGLSQVGNLFARVSRATKELGTSQVAVARITETVGLSLRVSGASAIEASSAMLQLSQSFASGLLNGQEFSAVAEAAPRLLTILAKSMGVARGALKEMSGQSKITSADLAKAFSNQSVLDDLRRQSDSIQTLSGAFRRLQDQILLFVGIGSQTTGAANALGKAILFVADNFRLIVGAITTLIAVKISKFLIASTLQWIDNGVAATAAAAATRTAGAAAITTAQAQVAATAVSARMTAVRVQEIRAAATAAAANVQLAATLNALLAPAQARAATAAAAHKAALQALIAAEGAAIVTTTALGRALALLGGPFGLVIIALGIAITTWDEWGDTVERNNKKAADSTDASSNTILAKLERVTAEKNKEIERINKSLRDDSKVKASLISQAEAEIANRQKTLQALRDRKATARPGQDTTPEDLGITFQIKKVFDLEVAISNLKVALEQLAIAQAKIPSAEKDKQLEKERKIREALAKAIKQEQNSIADLIAEQKRKLTLGRDLTKTEERQLDFNRALINGTTALTGANAAKNRSDIRTLGFLEQLIEANNQLAKSMKIIAGISTTAKNDAGKRLEDLQFELTLIGKTDLQIRTLTRNRQIDAKLQKDIAAVKKESAIFEKAAADDAAALQAAANANADELSRGRQDKTINGVIKKQDTTLKAITVTATAEDASLDKHLKNIGVLSVAELEAIAAKSKAEDAAEDKTISIAKAAIAAAEAQKRANRAVIDQFENDFRQGMLRLVEGGTGSWKAMMQSFRNSFKVTVMDFIFKQFAKPFVLKVVASVTGAFGANGLAAAANDAINEGGGDSTLGFIQMAANLRNSISGGFAALSASVAEGAAVFGQELANQGLTQLGQAISTNAVAIGQAASFAGAAAGGIAIGSFIAGDKEVAGLSGLQSSAIGAAIGGAAAAAFTGGIGAPLGAFIGGIFGGAIAGAFGRGPKRFGESTVAGNFSGSGFEGVLNTPFFQKGGRFRKNKRGVVTQGLSSESDNQLDSFVGTAGIAFARLISLSGDAARSVDGWSFSINRTLKSQESMNDLFNAMADSMGNFVVPEIAALRQEGENLADTAIRLGDEFLITQSIFSLLAFTTVDLGISSLAMRDNLVQLLGGIQGTTSVFSTFFNEFFSEEERAASKLRNLTIQFASIGLVLPETRAAFRLLAETLVQDVTPAGQQLFANVLSLSGAFADAVPIIDDNISAANDLKNAWQSVTDTIFREVARIRGLLLQDSPSSFAATQAKFAVTTAQARAGDQDAAKLLPALSQTLLRLAETNVTTLVELQRIRGQTAASLSTTGNQFVDQFDLDIPTFAGGGRHSGGLRIVGENGPELEATGPSRIFNASQIGDTGKLESLVVELTAEVRQLRREATEAKIYAKKTSKSVDGSVPIVVQVINKQGVLQ